MDQSLSPKPKLTLNKTSKVVPNEENGRGESFV